MAVPAFHPGERLWHEQHGIAERMAEIGPRAIRDAMPDQHRELFAQLPFALLGVVDVHGQPHAVLLAGPQGFIRSPDARTLELRFAYASDPALVRELAPGAAVGLLGIQPHTRRRNRANGVVRTSEDGALVVHVEQSFGNCPKHITQRQARFEAQPDALRRAAAIGGATLSAAAQHIVASADTFFIASAASPSQVEQVPPEGADVSHRGGPPGFVHLEQTERGSVLLVPDYAGNYMFNTLGNLTVHPRAGLLFLDFDYGDVLSLEVDASIIQEPSRVEAFPGAQRLLELRVRAHRLERGGSPLRWDV
jgi:predicted pyridoxine 5'-phosphate oxidase superfamily flavin-nucleotide-binding protein